MWRILKMTRNVRRINKLLNWFWACVLLAPFVAWLFYSAVGVFQGLPDRLVSVSEFINLFIGFTPAVDWLDSIWTGLFSSSGLLPFTNALTVSLPCINYLLFWSVIRLFISIFIWIPCFAQKIIERWF